jgi:PAS domain S-box-containing protein
MSISRNVLVVRANDGEDGTPPLFAGRQDVIVRRATRGSDLRDRLADTALDCVVYTCAADTGASTLDTLSAVRDRRPRVPILVYSPTTDGDLAIEATRRGATAYVSGEHLDATDDTLTDRVEETCARSGSARGGSRATVRELQTLVDNIATFAGLLDPDGTVRFANVPAHHSVDATPEAVEGSALWDAPWWSHSEALQERLREYVDRAAAGEPVAESVDARGADGERRTVELRLHPVRGADGAVAAIAVEGQDVTERERVTAELRESQSALQRLSRAVSEQDATFEEKIRSVLEVGCERLDLAVGFLSVIDPDEGRFEVTHARGSHELIQAGETSPLSQTYCRRTIDSDGPLAVRDAVGEGWTDDPAYRRFGLGCYLGERIEVDGELYGTLCFADRAPREASFSETERTFVELVSEWVSHELERLESQREREAARAKLENTLERIDDAFFSVDDDWRLTYVNDRFEDLLGRGPDELLGEHLWTEFPEAINDLFYEKYHEAMETQEPVAFEEYYDPVGAWFEVNAYPSEDGLSVFFRDVTDQKEYERVLENLLDTSRELMHAETPEEVAEIAVDAAENALGEDMTLVRLYDDETESLSAVAGSERAEVAMTERPRYGRGEGPVGRAFESGEPVVRRDLDGIEDGQDRSPAQSAMYLPIGDHGTMSVGAAETDAFDTSDRRYAQLLTATAAAALERLDRRRELRRYETVLETVQEKVYVLDEAGHFTLVSDPLAEWLGYDPDDLIGHHVSAVLGEDDISEGDRLLDELETNPEERSRVYELEGVSVDGERVPAEVELSPLPDDSDFDGSVGAVRDLSDLVSARREVRKERERFSYLFENLPDPVEETEFVGRDRVLREVNPAFERVFDVDGDALAGESRTGLAATAGLESPPTDDVSAGDGADDPIEFTTNTPSGRRHFLYRQIPYRTPASKRAFGIYTDVTTLKRRERHLQVLNRILRHNLRNDLNVVRGFAELLATDLDDASRRDRARRIHETADDLVELSATAQEIEQVIGRDVATETVDPVPMVTDLVAEYRTTHPYADIGAPELQSVPVAADERLRTALDRLLENAVEHTDADPPRVRLSVTTEDEWIAIRVSDNGPGIPETEWDVIVGEGEITPLEHGSGLGLWLVKWLVDAYGGDLAYTRSDLGGSAVTVRLRRASDAVETGTST